jgi:hypothetical protein
MLYSGAGNNTVQNGKLIDAALEAQRREASLLMLDMVEVVLISL